MRFLLPLARTLLARQEHALLRLSTACAVSAGDQLEVAAEDAAPISAERLPGTVQQAPTVGSPTGGQQGEVQSSGTWAVEAMRAVMGRGPGNQGL